MSKYRSMSSAENDKKELSRLRKENKALKASQNFGEGFSAEELQKVVNACGRMFGHINEYKRALVLTKDSLNFLDKAMPNRNRTFNESMKSTKHKVNASYMELGMLENDFRCIHHFINKDLKGGS